MERDLMQRLAKRLGLAKKFGDRYVGEDWPYLVVQHPAGAARVVGEAKGQLTGNGPVFLRGKVKHYPEMRPSLFRGVSSADRPVVRSAESALVREIRDRLTGVDTIGRLEIYDKYMAFSCEN